MAGKLIILHNLTINVLSATLRVILSLRLARKAVYIHYERSGGLQIGHLLGN